jgi:hypothetical protein
MTTDDEDLLMEAARYAVKLGCLRNRFMMLSKRAWDRAATEPDGEPKTGVKLNHTVGIGGKGAKAMFEAIRAGKFEDGAEYGEKPGPSQ